MNTGFGLLNEYSGDSTQLLYLRERQYSSNIGRFLTRDTWSGIVDRPQSLNWWIYVEDNPTNYIDPTGHIKEGAEANRADKIVYTLAMYNVFVKIDWGYSYRDSLPNPCGWNEGEWQLNELTEVQKGVVDLSNAMGGRNRFVFNLGYVKVYKTQLNNKEYIAVGDRNRIQVNNTRHDISHWGAVHELAHAWDANYEWKLSEGLGTFTHSYTDSKRTPYKCDASRRQPGCNKAHYYYGGVPAAGSGVLFTRYEDFAESVTAYVYPTEAQGKVNKYKGTSYEDLLYYADYSTTSRWVYVYSLIQTTASYQQK